MPHASDSADGPTLPQFLAELMARSHQRMQEALDGMSDEALWRQPGPSANTAGWLAWHLARWKDIQTARMAGEPQEWETGGWAARLGLEGMVSGWGDSPEQAAAFRAPRAEVLAYAAAAHEAALRRLTAATPDSLARLLPPARPGGESRPAWLSLLVNCIDFNEHTGQIAYLRGLYDGFGWQST